MLPTFGASGPQLRSRVQTGSDAATNAGTRRVLREVHDEPTEGVSKSWFKRAKLSPCGRDCSLNYFGVDASRPLSEWRNKGWINPDDPRGWFQWYCRYYMGRRIPEEDRRQIKRWKAFRRHIAQVRMNCEPGDPFCRPRQRQALLHWAYDSRKISGRSWLGASPEIGVHSRAGAVPSAEERQQFRTKRIKIAAQSTPRFAPNSPATPR